MNIQISPEPRNPHRLVLHYTGANDDRGGVMSVIRALAGAGRFECILGVNPGFIQRRPPPLAVIEFREIAGEKIGLQTLWRARSVARAVRVWLSADATRVFHAHSRAGLIVGVLLAREGERRVVVSVHCYGRQRWFYRWAARQLGGRLYWLSPAMKRHYGIGDGSWSQCIPGCIPVPAGPRESRPAKDPATLRLAGIGALVRWKGWHLVLAALASLPGEVRGRIRFCHIGGPDGSPESQQYADGLRATTASLGLARTVEWRGEQSSAAGLLAESDCLVVASDREPFSIAVLEALSAGLPVLAADSGGAVDLLKPDETGWFFRSGDALELARVMAALLHDGKFLRARITPEVVRDFAAPVVAQRWEEVYATL